MSVKTFQAAIPLAAMLCGAVAATKPASAFSQIGSETGTTTQREGIVSVPLPPLPGETGGENPAPTGAPPAPDGGGEAQGGQAPPQPSPATVPPSNGPATAPAEPDDPVGTTDDGETETPLTGPGEPAPSQVPAAPDPAVEDDPAAPASGTPTPAPQGDDAAVSPPAPPIVYGEEGLPPPVRDLRERLIAIARAGDIEALRPYIEVGEDATLLSFGGSESDPITFLKSASGDGEGLEVLAILLEILQSGHVRNEPATENEIFVWPYFTALSIDKLTKSQKVELFELVTAGDYQEMLGFGAYNFYRVGISPDGKLQFFVAGD